MSRPSLKRKTGMCKIVGERRVENGNHHSNAMFVKIVIVLATASLSALGK
jgi:hypothetical protein